MIRSWFVVALRHMWRLKAYTFINVAGLAVGIAACAFMLLFIRHELSYDRFHEDAGLIYRIATESERDGRVEGAAVVYMPVVARLGEIAGIETMTLVQGASRHTLKQDGEFSYVDGIAMADEHVFDVFDFRLMQGDPQTALVDPFSLVVTEEMAHRLFGETDVMGRVVNLGDHDFSVTGILAPVPSTSHWQFEAITSRSTGRATFGPAYDRIASSWFSVSTVYIRVADGQSVVDLESKLNALMADVRPSNVNPTYRMFLQPLTDIHLHSKLKGELGPPGDTTTLYVFGAIAALILLIACINYMNLATARSMRRAREVGLRKVVGAGRAQLVAQFLGESVLTSLVAAALAVVLLAVSLPATSALVGRTLDFNLLTDPMLSVGIFGVALVVGVAAGAYPAFFLSSSAPIGAIGSRQMSVRHGSLRRALVVVQFAVSIAFIAGTGVILDQLNFIRTADLGFDRERIISLSVSDAGQFNSSYSALKQELERLQGVTSVTASMGQPGIWTPEHTLDPDADGGRESIDYDWFAADFDFVRTFGIDVVRGRDLDATRVADSTSSFLINESGALALGLDDPIGHDLQLEINGRSGTIVGVVEDFHTGSLREAIRPTLLYMTELFFFSNVYVRVQGEDLPATLDAIKSVWRSFFPDVPVEYAFYDDEFDAQYANDRRTARIAGVSTLLALFVACLGLFGLAAFAAEQRTREVGVRKVLGASTRSLVVLLSKDFLILVVVAFVVASPLAWIAANRWLDGFAYHIRPGVGVFVAAAVIAVVIALVTVSTQAARAALADPVKSLRHE